MKGSTVTKASDIAAASKVPLNGVLNLNCTELRKAGILTYWDGANLKMWSDPDCNTNEEFSEASVALCDSGNFDGPESHLMYDAINRAELNIRLIRVLQGRS